MKRILAAALTVALCLALVSALAYADGSVKRLLTLDDLYEMDGSETLTVAEILPLLDALREDAYREGYNDAISRGVDGAEPMLTTRAALLGGDVETYALNAHTLKFHHMDCKSVKKIAAENYKEYTGTRDEVIELGYEPCGICHP